tara:strand:+ start:16725 stop:20957 length:4233 start_codon:yes stop_codon:yes gene_type:complete
MPISRKGRQLKLNGKLLLQLELVIGFIIVSFLGFFLDYIGIVGYSLKMGLSLGSIYFFFLLLSIIFSWVKENLKSFILAAYIISLLYCIFISYLNNFSSAHYYSFLLIFLFFSFVQDRVRYFLICSSVVVSGLLLGFLFSKNLEIEEGFIFLLSFLVVFILGLTVTFSRERLKSNLISRKNLLNYIFNNASDGLILVNKKNSFIEDCNSQALEILRITTRNEIVNHRIDTIQYLGSYLFKDKLEEDLLQTIELADKRILNFTVKSFHYSKNEYWLIDLKVYQNRLDLNVSEEFNLIIKNSEDNYRYLFEESSSMICIMDMDGYVKDVNQTFLKEMNYSKEELVGKKFDYLDENEGQKAVNELILKGKLQEFHKRLIDGSGKVKEIETVLKSGKYFGENVIISNSRDITARKDLERRVNLILNRYKALFDLSPISIIILDSERKIVNYNPAFKKLFKYHEVELTGKRIREFSHPEDYYLNDENMVLLLSGKKNVVTTKKRFIDKEGKVLNILMNISLLKEEDEIGYRILVHMIDLSEITKIQKRIEISDKSYKELFDNSLNLLYVLNSNNEFIDVNQSVLELYGYSKEEIIGKYPDLFAAPDLNDMIYVQEKIKKAWLGETQNLLWWSIKKNGDIFPKELNLKLVNYKGENVLLATGQDISETYNYEKQLRDKERRFRQLFERNLAGIYRTNREGFLLECNLSFAQILGFSSVEEIKQKVNATDFYFSESDRNYLIEKIEKTGNLVGEKVNLKKVNGESISAIISVSQIFDEDNQFKYFEGNVIDITKLDEAQKELTKSREDLRKLIDYSPFGVLIIQHNKIQFANEKAIHLLEYEKLDNLVNIQFSELFSPENQHFSLELLDESRFDEIAFKEFQLQTLNHKRIDVELKATFISFNNIKSTLISIIDLSYKKKILKEKEKVRSVETLNKMLQAELEEKERTQKRLVDAQSYTEGIIESSVDMIFTANINYQLNRLNSAALNEFKIDKIDSEKSIYTLFDSSKETIKVLNTLETSKTFSGEVWLRRSDQTTFPAYLSLSYLFNSDEEVLGIMGVARNISDIKSKENEIKEQASKLNAIIESSSHSFFTVNNDYVLTSFNKPFQEDLMIHHNLNIHVGMEFKDTFAAPSIEEKEFFTSFWNVKFKEVFSGKSLSFEVERTNIRGDIYYREIFLNPIFSNNVVSEVSGIAHDITEKKRNEIKLYNSLKEKEVLLKEVHHRVKNNMQVISSILSLQSAYVHDQTILNILRESQNRIKSMAFIHESLYRTKDFSKIVFSEYLKNLAQNLIDTYELKTNDVSLIDELDKIYLNLDSAIPCGLIVNELISNSLKYAFVENQKGEIYLSLKEIANNGNTIELVIADNGVGISDEIDISQTETLGLQLVSTLVEQIEGNIKIETNKGTRFTITFEGKQE